MSSSTSRGQIVLDALSLAGRSTELKSAATQWLNYGLRDLGLTFRFPELRKTGSAQTLSAGSNTSPLPSDFGAGMEKSGMLVNDTGKVIEEVSFEDFSINQNSPIQNATGSPLRYIVSLESSTFRFDKNADKAYTLIPTYFKTPPLLSTDSSDDSKKIWLDNDAIAVHMLMWWIYIFTEDPREMAQEARVNRMVTRWQRETVKMGGTSRVLPSPARFKNLQYRGFGSLTGP